MDGTCPLDTDSRVTMTIRDEWGSTVYQRDYGVCSGMFESEEVYLPQIGAQTTYRVTLSTDSGENSFTVVRVAPRLTDSNVTTDCRCRILAAFRRLKRRFCWI